MSDEDFSGGVGASGRGAGAPGKHRGPRFTWNAQYEATFFRSLCESVQLGLRDGSTFKPEAWDRAMQALIDKHSAYANKSHLINKTDNARKKYRLWRGLREDPEFYYNSQTRTVSATDDAWSRHLQKEPLARSLRARPFEHEEFYETLFPDVIGSGGAPKRLTKPRRKGTDTLGGTDEFDGPGTATMDLLTDGAYINPSQTRIPPPMPPAPMPAPMVSHPPPPQQHHARGPTTSMAPPPPRSSVSSASALTPPEETTHQTRKRLQAPDSSTSGAGTGQPSDKRRRTAAPGYLDLTQQQQQVQQHVQQPQPVPSSSTTSTIAQQPTPSSTSALLPSTTTTVLPATTTGTVSASALSEAVHLVLSEALLHRSASSRTTTTSSGGNKAPSSSSPSLGGTTGGLWLGGGWQEQAMDTFFRDFAAEDMDLQLKIAEKVLTDENKAMVFCKMPDALRRHWVKRLREVHNRIA